MRRFVAQFYRLTDQRGFVASLTLDVLRAAEAGDRVARGIMRRAGRDMADQVLALVRRHAIPDREVLLAGSVWRDNLWMRRAFLQRLRGEDASYSCLEPAFRTVVAGPAKLALEQRGGEALGTEEIDFFLEAYGPQLLMAKDQARRSLLALAGQTESTDVVGDDALEMETSDHALS